jgi:HlyD family secretion protein
MNKLNGTEQRRTGMDKAIEKKTWTAGRIVLIACFLLIIVSMVYLFAVRPEGSRLKVDSSRRTFSKVVYGEFREYYPFDARVEPVTSVYLDVETGGRVEQIFVEDGKYVKKGELILRFSNANLQRNSIDTETRLLENLNIQRTTQLQLEQNKLMLSTPVHKYGNVSAMPQDTTG